jgi:hypothetical protein
LQERHLVARRAEGTAAAREELRPLRHLKGSLLQPTIGAAAVEGGDAALLLPHHDCFIHAHIVAGSPAGLIVESFDPERDPLQATLYANGDQYIFYADGKIAHALAVCMKDGVGDSWGYADERDFAEALDAERIDVRILLVDEMYHKLRNVEIHGHGIVGRVSVD